MPENVTTTLSHTGRLLAAATSLVLAVGSLTACGSADDSSGADNSKPTPVTSPSTSDPSAPGASSSPDSDKSSGAAPTTDPDAPSSPMAKRNADDPNDRLHQWMESGSIPMNSAYHWPILDGSARIADGEKFLFEEHCTSQRTPQVDSAVRGAWMEKARPGKNDGNQNWLAQETIAEVKQGGERNASAMFDGLVKELLACDSGGTSVRLTSHDSRHVAATVVLDSDDAPRPTTLHEYLAVEGNNVLELSLWVTPYNEDGGGKPDVPWPNPSDETVFDAMTLPVRPDGKHEY